MTPVPTPDEIAERQQEWSVVTKEIYEKGKIAGAKSEREQVLQKLLEKIDKCISSCPADAKQKPKTMLKYFRATVESLRAQPENSSSREK